jgi:uncharacterized protein
MEKLARVTEIKGQALAIGHVGVKGDTCSAGVWQSMDLFKKRNIKIVPVSDLLSNELTKKNFLP